MKNFCRIVLLLLLGVLVGCASTQAPLPEVKELIADARFSAYPEPSAEALFALSPEMRHFLAHDLRAPIRDHGVAMGLFRALTQNRHLRIDYDASYTRTAAQAFEARSGNCLSLVLLTAALAQELGLSVHFQWVEVPEIWSRSDQFTLLNGHVNLNLSQMPPTFGTREMGRLTVDFVGVEEPRLSRVRPLDQKTVVAMFFNNRAVELMESGALGEAHANLRAALRADGQHVNTYNTLAVLYRRIGDLPRAEALLAGLRQTAPGNHHVASNLALVWRQQGRVAEAERLEASQPEPPFAEYDRGMAMVAQSRWREALAAFERQQRLAPDFHGVHFQLARVHFQLGNLRMAQKHLEEAVEESTTLALRQRYQAKLRALQRAS